MQQMTVTAAVVVSVLILGEFGLHVIRRTAHYDAKDALANLCVGIVGGIFVRLLWNAVMLGGFVGAYQLSPLRIDGAPWWYWPVALLLSDLCFYWYHRAGHRVRFLWGTHSVHHSSEDLNLSTAIRLSWVESSYRWILHRGCHEHLAKGHP